MTADDSETTTESSTNDSTTDDAPAGSNKSEIESLRDELEVTKVRLRTAERNLRWMAQQQATETGKSVCPQCNSGGSLTVERTATGKKKVECRNCGERFV
ncbi:zinc-ribbon domain-containing protein [Haladaptatus halobius]|uniref:zinc-ribbon domain-containing protein n=1 Tax=Haladaptatus halobius TaxID=2884875 RepID=UPI001D0AC900|nr:zinc-ribbon domain-containing protein [Haladaptatus halobius]